MLLPCSIFCSLRAVGLRPLEAGIAAVLAVLISDGSEYGMGLQYYTFGTVGIITQLWALVFLTPAIACSFNYLRHRTHLGCALGFGFLTFGSHVVAAVVLLTSIGVFALVDVLCQRRVSRRLFVLIGLLALVTAHQWWFVFSDSAIINRSMLEPAWKYQGRGIVYLTQIFWAGGLFDTNRFPIITLLLVVSLCFTVSHWTRVRKESGGEFSTRATLLFVLFFSMCAGREVWGWLFDLLPVMKSLHVHRFALAVHLFGIITISVGVGALIRICGRTAPRLTLVLFLFVVVLRPAILERYAMYRDTAARHTECARLVAIDPEFAQLLSALPQLPYGWTYIGSKTSWQRSLVAAGFIPLDLFTVSRGVPTVGGILLHAFSLAGETLFDFDPAVPAHFDLFGIRNVIAPASWQGVADFSRVGVFGRYSLWSRESHMLFVGDDRFATRLSYLGETLLVRQFVQGLRELSGGVGRIAEQVMEHPWHFEGTAVMERDGRVLAAVGYHPNWEVTIDGSLMQTQWSLPGFMLVSVPKGTHRIAFHYRGSVLKLYLLLGGLGVIFTVLARWYFRQSNKNAYPSAAVAPIETVRPTLK
jgi:hypothetical protein